MSDTRRLEVDCAGRTAHVEVMGHGPDVVFVGSAVPMAWTRPAALALSASGYRVVNFDYGSDDEDPEPRTCLEQVDDVVAVMDAVEVASGAIVGMSRGAITAYGLAAERERRADSLVLAFPVAGFADTLSSVEPEPEPQPGEREEDFMLRSLQTVFSDEYLQAHMEEAMSLVMTPPGSVRRVEREDESPFQEDWVVSCPVMVIEGGRDRVVGPEHPARYLAAVPGARREVVPHASHGWLMEDPAGFAALIGSFV